MKIQDSQSGIEASAGFPGQREQPAKASSPGDLVARRVDAPPGVDGAVDAVWAGAAQLRVPLAWGIRGTEHALDVEVRALYTADAIYLLAQWPGAAPAGQPDTVANKLTVHWQITALAGGSVPACDVACHTAFADDQGRIAYANAETIPQGGDATLPVAGGWRDGLWTVEWSRPLVNSNPYDLQFSDLGQSYSFFVKLFERVEGRPDPVSERHQLVFQR